MVERFGLFTIIVLGEVVIGVVVGLSAAEQDAADDRDRPASRSSIGFGFWWMYFDVVGRRLPQAEGAAVATWIVGHFPITLAIAASGAAMVSLIEHAGEPDGAARDRLAAVGGGRRRSGRADPHRDSARGRRRLAVVYRPVAWAMAAGAVAALAVGWLNPAPWLLALLLVLILGILWAVALAEFLRADAWAEADELSPGEHQPEPRPAG